MCVNTIIGWNGNSGLAKRFLSLSLIMSEFGAGDVRPNTDGFGIVSSDEAIFHRCDSRYSEDEGFVSGLGNLPIGPSGIIGAHQRRASTGNISSGLTAHPYKFEKNGVGYYCAHNGFIQSSDSEFDQSSSTDSWAAFNMLFSGSWSGHLFEEQNSAVISSWLDRFDSVSTFVMWIMSSKEVEDGTRVVIISGPKKNLYLSRMSNQDGEIVLMNTSEKITDYIMKYASILGMTDLPDIVDLSSKSDKSVTIHKLKSNLEVSSKDIDYNPSKASTFCSHVGAWWEGSYYAYLNGIGGEVTTAGENSGVISKSSGGFSYSDFQKMFRKLAIGNMRKLDSVLILLNIAKVAKLRMSTYRDLFDIYEDVASEMIQYTKANIGGLSVDRVLSVIWDNFDKDLIIESLESFTSIRRMVPSNISNSASNAWNSGTSKLKGRDNVLLYSLVFGSSFIWHSYRVNEILSAVGADSLMRMILNTSITGGNIDNKLFSDSYSVCLITEGDLSPDSKIYEERDRIFYYSNRKDDLLQLNVELVDVANIQDGRNYFSLRYRKGYHKYSETRFIS